MARGTALLLLQTRQTWTLVWKNIVVVLFRHAFSTPLRAFLLPVIFTGFLAYARNVGFPFCALFWVPRVDCVFGGWGGENLSLQLLI